MRTRLLTALTNFFARPARSAPPVRPALEQLEDRCVPSASPMQPMGMNMMDTPPSMNMMSTSPAGVNPAAVNLAAMNALTHAVNPATVAALDQLFTDFQHTLQQVLSSKSLSQFVTNETAMIHTLAADLGHLGTVISSNGHMV